MTYQDGQKKVDCGGKAGTTSTHALPIALETILALISVQLSTPIVVVALIATLALGAAGVAVGSPPTSKTQAQMVGVFTGEYINGAPVYRLPPVIVVASGKVERTKLEREKQPTRAEQARAKAAAKRPA